jgi:hypothetical protein
MVETGWSWSFATSSNDARVVVDKLMTILSPEMMSAWLGGEVGPYLSERAKSRFVREGDDVSEKWAPLKESTVQIRIGLNLGGEHPINRRTGELEAWVVGSGWNAYPTGIGATLRYPKKKPSGTLLDKVTTAQKGSPYPATVPRPVLGINENDMLYITALLAANVMEAVR